MFKEDNVTSLHKTKMLICLQIFAKADSISSPIKNLLAWIFFTVAVFGIMINSFLVLLIQKRRRFHKNQSIRLIMYLSLVDIYSCVFLNVAYICFLWHKTTMPCSVIVFLYGVSRFAMYSTAYMALMTGLDRFLHIAYLNEYSTVYTKFRFKLSLVGYFMLVLTVTVVTTVTNTRKGLGAAGKYTSPVNIILVALTILMYLLSVYTMQKHKKDNIKLSRTSQRVVRIALVYLILFIVLHGVLGLYQMLFIRYWKHKAEDEISSVMWFIVLLLPSLGGIVNAAMFLVINRIFIKPIVRISDVHT